MGGSGGGGNYRLNPSEITRLREEARARLDRSRVDADVNALLEHELVDLNDRDVELVNQRLGQIEQALQGAVTEFDRVMFGGSTAKHTYVDGISDIDSLVVLDPTVIHSSMPEELRNKFRDALRGRMNMADVVDIHAGDMAVTVVYEGGMMIQLLPATQQGDSLAISSPGGGGWARINPKEFAVRLSRLNESQGHAVVPAIKLAKAIIVKELPEHVRPSGYHVEALALAAFDDYTGPRTPKAMVQRFFESASREVMAPIGDVTGQSRYIDESLGPVGSAQRQGLARSLGQVAKKMQQSDSIDEWRQLLAD